MTPERRMFPWVGVFIAIQLILVGLFFNPWVGALRWAAIFVFAVEVFALVFWAFPIFLYQLLVKQRSWRESLRTAVKSIVDVISYTFTSV